MDEKQQLLARLSSPINLDRFVKYFSILIEIDKKLGHRKEKIFYIIKII